MRILKLNIDSGVFLNLIRKSLVELPEAEYGDYINSAIHMLDQDLLVIGATTSPDHQNISIELVSNEPANPYILTAGIHWDKQVGQ
jgi:hypothetical protein